MKLGPYVIVDDGGNYVASRPERFHKDLRNDRELKQTTTTTVRERHQTKGLMSRTMAMHVRCKSLYISLPSSAKQQRELTKFCVVYGTWTTTANFTYFHLELHAAIAH